MTIAKKGILLVCILFSIGSLVYFVSYASQPITWFYSFSYSPYIHFHSNLEISDEEAVFTSATIAHLAPGIYAGDPLPDNLNVTLYIKGEAIQISEITTVTIARLGGYKLGGTPETSEIGDRWDIEEIGSFWFKDGNLWSVSLSSVSDSKFSWDSNQILNLPITESALREGWGAPDKVAKQVRWTRWKLWTHIDF